MKRVAVLDAPADPEPNLYLAWYETWRAAEERERAAEAAARAEMARGVRLLVGLLVAWTVIAGLAGGAALMLWTGR